MQVVESIKKAREKKIDDQLILDEIRKQNPEKEPFFKKAEERGASSTNILDEIIKQNSPQKKPVVPETPASPPPEKKETPSLKKEPPQSKEGKTVLTKEAQEREEEMRQQFLKRIEAKERGEGTGDNGFFSSPSQKIESSGEEMITDVNPSNKTKMPTSLIVVVGILFLGAFILLSLNFL
jgi:hypothetical protein